MERSKAIKALESMRNRMDIFDTIAPTEERKKAIDLAIVSLKTDEAYNLMYEHADVQEIPTGSTTKNDLGVDCIDRQATLDAIIKRLGIKNETYLLEAERVIYQQILAMPSVTPISKECIDCIAEDKTFIKMDRIKQLLDSDKIDDMEVLKKIREVVEE